MERETDKSVSDFISGFPFIIFRAVFFFGIPTGMVRLASSVAPQRSDEEGVEFVSSMITGDGSFVLDGDLDGFEGESSSQSI